MMRQVALVSLLLGLFVLPPNLFAQRSDGFGGRLSSLGQAKTDSTKNKKKYPSPKGALWRALLFPGWGQWYNGKKWKAALVFTTEFGLITTAVYWNQKAQSAQNSYDRDFFVNNRNLSNWWLLLTVFLSATDAYIDAQLANFDVSPDLSMQTGQIKVGLCVNWRQRN